MAEPAITNSAGVTFTFESGEVASVQSDIVSDIDPLALPASGPSQTFLFDYAGVLKNIILQGVLFETSTSRTDSGTTTTILQQKQWIEKNLNGQQTANTFSSTYDSQTYNGSSFETTKIMFSKVSFTERSGDPESLAFTINLIVGAS